MDLRKLSETATELQSQISKLKAELDKTNAPIESRWKALGGGHKSSFKSWEYDPPHIRIVFERWDEHGHDEDVIPADIFAEPSEEEAIRRYKQYLKDVLESLAQQSAVRREQEEKELMHELMAKYLNDPPPVAPEFPPPTPKVPCVCDGMRVKHLQGEPGCIHATLGGRSRTIPIARGDSQC